MDSPDHNLDFDRMRRVGFPEVVYGQGKTLESLLRIVESHRQAGRNCLVTRLATEHLDSLQERFPGGFYDPVGRLWMLEERMEKRIQGTVAVVSAGTSDAPVANEAYYTLRYMGATTEQVHDIGIAGLHRLLGKLDFLKTFEVLIVIAGFEGALPTVVGGLLGQPIIAVPTSVGYGVAAGGVTALNGMLSSCANGLTVVNIDNGYGAAMAALRILQSVHPENRKS